MKVFLLRFFVKNLMEIGIWLKKSAIDGRDFAILLRLYEVMSINKIAIFLSSILLYFS
jgi:hypothetical protein